MLDAIPIQRVAQATRGTPFEGKIWLVGGAVRDELLNIPTHDFDLVTELDAIELCDLIWKAGISQIPPRIEGDEVEFITARKESYRSASRKPAKVERATLHEDALRRDLTINTLLKNIHTGELRDPTGKGIADLTAKILRTPDVPSRMVNEDPLRMMRIVRFKTKLGFELAPGLEETLKDHAERIQIVSQERIRDEFSATLLLDHPSPALRDLQKLGILKVFAPELDAMQGVEQGKWHKADVFEHTMHVLDGTKAELVIRLAALFHDIGKPETKLLDDKGEIRFFGHETVGAAITRRVLYRMRFAKGVVDVVCLLVRNHMRLGSTEKFSPAAARRLLRDLNGHEELLFDLVTADMDALRTVPKKTDIKAIRKVLSEVSAITPRSKLESPLTGEEIMIAFGLEPGAEVGKWKSALQEQVLEGALAPGDKDSAIAWLKREFGPA